MFIFETARLFGLTAGIISFFAYLIYIVSIFRRKTRPNRATWWILTFVGTVTGLSYYFSGAVETIWVPIADVLGILIIALLSIKYGEGGRNTLDITCFVVSVMSVFLWYLSKNPIVALILNLLMDFVGIIPTIKKSYIEPTSESRSSWLLTFIGNILNFGAVTSTTFGILIYPIYMSVTSGIFVVLLYFRKFRLKTKSNPV